MYTQACWQRHVSKQQIDRRSCSVKRRRTCSALKASSLCRMSFIDDDSFCSTRSVSKYGLPSAMTPNHRERTKACLAFGYLKKPRRHRCAGDSGVEPHAKWNLTHVGWINSARSLTLVPSTDFGWEPYPSGLWIETKPQNIFDAAVELQFTSHRRHGCPELEGPRFPELSL